MHSKINWLALTLLLLSVACASTTLHVPANAGANPDAESMPLPSDTQALRADYDPWATEPAAVGPKAPATESGHEGHENHEGHQGHPHD